MINKLKQHSLGTILDHILAIIVLIGIIIALFSLWDTFVIYWENRHQTGAFLDLIASIFNIVIGVEFFKLLWKPGKDTLLEVLMFVIARNMIISHSTALENLLSIAGIGILFAIDFFILHNSCNSFNEEEKPE